MDFYTFLDSSFSLVPYLYSCADAGMEIDRLSDLFRQLRIYGIDAENEMFKATKGVNTHKGAIFIFGILVAAVSYANEKENRSLNYVSYLCSEICNKIVDVDFSVLRENDSLTVGERLYFEYGIRGIRGEAEAGFPTLFVTALPFFRGLIKQGCSINDSAIQTLLIIISKTCDTNIISRVGFEGLKYAQKMANDVLEIGGIIKERKLVENMDQEFIRRNISPGGCADLLAATCFLYFLQEEELIELE